MIATLLQLVWSYLKIGFFGFGGGYAMLSLIHSEVVVRNEWLTNGEFSDIIAISQMTPGPIALNSATYIGYEVAGVLGSVVATVAVCIPALTLMMLLTRFFLKLHNNRYVQSVVVSMRPVVVGMIMSAALLLIFPHSDDGRSFIDGWSWLIFALALLGSAKKINPILLIVLSGIAGIIIYWPQ
ncbi:MAG: chromate transporter [Alistipes sp.]|nr:chromate transporter [Alistipes sp.]MBQ8774980.1 chromate transporter [Alistipes sp.]